VRTARLASERRRRGDLVAAAVLVVVLAAAAVTVWRTGAVAGTTAEPSDTPIAAPPQAAGFPAGFTEAWRAPSALTEPVVAGPAVVTAAGRSVLGRDASTGAEAWSYTRDRPLCTVGAGFPAADGGIGRVLALYEGGTGYCSELTALRPDTGERVAASNPDVRPGTRLVADGGFVLATGSEYLEAIRSDLVMTLEYGDVPAPAQVGRQPRPECRHASAALAAGRVGVVERCPGEPTDRLTVVAADGEDGAETPQVEFSVALPAAGATLVAVSAERAAVALPNPPRLQLLDAAGQQVDLLPLDVPASDLTGGAAAVESGAEAVYWWTGTRTIALDGTDLVPLWTVDGTLGPALRYGGSLLVPVPAGLGELDEARGTVRRTLPVARDDPTAAVRLGAVGEVLLEQRGAELVALRPTP
jgi:hypothetical protein